MYKQVKLSPLPDKKFIVLEDIKYKEVVVSKGYKTNGADVPRIFWSFYPPNNPDYLPAVIIHDYMCDMGQYEKGDLYFREILREIGISSLSVFILYYGVKIAHKISGKY